MKYLIIIFALVVSGFECSAAESLRGLCVFTYGGEMKHTDLFQVDIDGKKLGQIEFKGGGFATYRIQAFKSESGEPAFALTVSFKYRNAAGQVKLINAGEVFSDKVASEDGELKARINLLNPRIADLLSISQKDLSFYQAHKALGLDEREETMLGALCGLK